MNPELETVIRCGLTSVEKRGRIPSYGLLATLLLMQPRILLAFFAARAHCWLMSSLVSSRTTRFFSLKLLSSQFDPSIYW